IVSDELVVRARLRIVEDRAQLFQVPGAQQMIDVDEGGFRERAQHLAPDDEHVAPHGLLDSHAIPGTLAIGRAVRAEWQPRRWLVGRSCRNGSVHGLSSVNGSRQRGNYDRKIPGAVAAFTATPPTSRLASCGSA